MDTLGFYIGLILSMFAHGLQMIGIYGVISIINMKHSGVQPMTNHEWVIVWNYYVALKAFGVTSDIDYLWE